MSIKPHRGCQKWWTEEEIFESLRQLANRLGRTPTYREINNQNGCPAESALRMRFGSTRVALELAGLELTNHRSAGRINDLTRRRAEMIRAMRAEGKTLQTIAAALGMSRFNVWRICDLFGIKSSRDWGPKKQHDKRYIPPPIDPEKARQITQNIKAYWLGEEKAS